MNEEKRSNVRLTVYQGEGEFITHEAPAAVTALIREESIEVHFAGELILAELVSSVHILVQSMVQVLVEQGMDPDFVGEAVTHGIRDGIMDALEEIKKKGGNNNGQNN